MHLDRAFYKVVVPVVTTVNLVAIGKLLGLTVAWFRPLNIEDTPVKILSSVTVIAMIYNSIDFVALKISRNKLLPWNIPISLVISYSVVNLLETEGFLSKGSKSLLMFSSIVSTFFMFLKLVKDKKRLEENKHYDTLDDSNYNDY